MTESLTYRYRATTSSGAIETGALQAESRSVVAEHLARRGLLAIDIRMEAASDERRPMPADELSSGLYLLAQFLRAGLPLPRALAALSDSASSSWRSIVPQVGESLRQGRPFALALKGASRAVPDVVLGIIEAGESGPGLAEALSRAAAVIEAAHRTRTAVLSALAYPFVLAVAATASLSLLVGLVLPRFAALLGDLGQTLPTSTRIVLGAGTMARHAAIPALAVFMGAGVLLRIGARDEGAAERLAMFLQRLPGVGPIRIRLATSRACDTLAALLASGVPISRCLPAAARASGDAATAAALRRAREQVIAGSSLSAALGPEGSFSSGARRLIRAGEDTGRLADLLAHAAAIERTEAESRTRVAVRLIEPALILFFGGLVALAAAALLQALYGIRPT